MKLTLIAAIANDGIIGSDGALPWRLRADLAQFQRRTLGHPIVMGRKTWESLPKRPLAGRLNLVLTRAHGYVAEGATIVRDLDAAIAAARAVGAEEAFVIGGESVYAAALPHADALVITHVDADVEGDARFCEVDWARWRRVSEEAFGADERNEHPFRVVVYERSAADGRWIRPSGDP